MAGEQGFHLATAYVLVEPDAEDFAEKLKAELEKVEAEVRVHVAPDTEGFREEVQAELEDEDPVRVPAEPDAEGFREKLEAEVGGDENPVGVPVEPDAEDFEEKLAAAVDAAHATAEVGAELAPGALPKLQAEVRTALDAGDADEPKIEVGARLNPASLGGVMAEARAALEAEGLNLQSYTITRPGLDLGEDIARDIDNAGPAIDKAASAAGSHAGGLFSHGWMMNLAIAGALAAPLAGGMIGGALVAGITAVVIDKTPALKAAVESSFKLAASGLAQDIAPAAQSMTGALTDLADTLGRLGPQIESMFSAAAPDIGRFITGLGLGVTEFLPGFTRGLTEMQPAMLAAEQAMGELGKTLGDLFASIEANGAGTAFAQALTAILSAVDQLAPALGRLAGTLSTGLAEDLRAVLPPAAELLSWAADAANAITRISPALSGAALGFLLLRGPVIAAIGAFRAMGAAAALAASGTADFTVSADVAAGVAGGWGWLSRAAAEMSALGAATVATASSEGILAAATGVLEGAWGALAAVNPLVWIGAGAVAAWEALAAAENLGRDAVNSQADALRKQYDAFGYNVSGMEKYSAALETVKTQTVDASHSWLSGLVDALSPIGSLWSHATTTAAISNADAVSTSTRNLRLNLSQLGTEFGMTRSQVIAAAVQLGISASAFEKGGSAAQAAREKFINWVLAGEQGASAAEHLSTEMAILGRTTSTAAQDVNALNNAYNALIQPQLTLMNDSVAFKSSQITLAGALEKSHDELGDQTAAQRAATTAMTAAVAAAHSQSDAIRSAGGSSQAAIAPLRALVSQIEAAGVKGSAAAKILAFLRSQIAVLHSKTIDIEVNVAEHGGTTQLGGFSTTGGRRLTAAGGVMPGYAPGVDSIPAMLSPGEGVLVPEAVRALSPAFVHAANARFGGARVTRGSNTGHYAAGGIAASASLGFPQDVFNITVMVPGSEPLSSAASGADSATLRAMRQAAQTIRQSMESYADLSGITTGTTSSGKSKPVTGERISHQLGQKLGTLRKFFAVIGRLQADRLGRTLIDEVISLGPAEGLQYGDAILSGGPRLIRHLDALESGIATEERRIGRRGAEIQYLPRRDIDRTEHRHRDDHHDGHGHGNVTVNLNGSKGKLSHEEIAGVAHSIGKAMALA